MCGITGYYNPSGSFSPEKNKAIAKSMADEIRHRGPDSDGLWADPDCPIILAHRRLAILDLSAEGHQPMHSPSGRYVISYNGEIYNFPELRQDLEKAGATFRGRSDTEILLAAIDHWGLNRTLQKLIGMFAFALWDRQDRVLHFARDPLGKKPLYVGWAGPALVFGSELKTLMAHPDFNRNINRDAISQYMHLASVPAPHTIFENVWTLPAGHRLSLAVQALDSDIALSTQMEPYWKAPDILDQSRLNPHQGPENAWVVDFEALLTRCTQDRMISDVPLGAFLSGGLDSSLIVALMQKLSNQPVKTYTIGFEEDGYNEAGYARKIADHLGTDHHEMMLSGQNALDLIPSLPELYDEPFGDISAIPTALVAQFARRDVTVALSGDGGDEMLGGYNRHFTAPKIAHLMKALPHFARSGLAGLIRMIPQDRWDKINPTHPQFGTRLYKAADILSLKTEVEIYDRLVSHWQEPLTIGAERNSSLFYEQSDWQPQGLSFAENMMLWDTLGYLPNDILVKVDRATMGIGLEARAPLLDKRLFDFVWRLPEQAKIRNGQGKWLIRQVLKNHIPDDLFNRPKQGFAIPVAGWLNGPLRDWAECLLDQGLLSQQGYLDSEIVQKKWTAFKQGRTEYATQLWTVLMFQGWLEKWSNAHDR